MWPNRWYAEKYDTWDNAWPIICVVCGAPATCEVGKMIQVDDPEDWRPVPFKIYVCDEHEDVDMDEAVRRSGTKLWGER